MTFGCKWCGSKAADLNPRLGWLCGQCLLRGWVVHCKREPYDVYIGRPSKWGNPFSVVEYGREEAIGLYEAWLETKPALLAALPELRGKALGCWCAPRACHGDVLSRLANA